MSRESWVEITRRRAVTAQIRAAMAAEMAQLAAKCVYRPAPMAHDFTKGLSTGQQILVATVQGTAAWEADKARRAYDHHLAALASEAAMPPSLKVAS